MSGRRKPSTSAKKSKRKKKATTSSGDEPLDIESDDTEVINASIKKKSAGAALEDTQLFPSQESTPIKKTRGRPRKVQTRRQRTPSCSTTDTEENLITKKKKPTAKSSKKKSAPRSTSSSSDSRSVDTKIPINPSEVQLATPDDPIMSVGILNKNDHIERNQSLSLETQPPSSIPSRRDVLQNTPTVDEQLPTSKFGILTSGSGKPVSVNKETVAMARKKLKLDSFTVSEKTNANNTSLNDDQQSDDDDLPTKEFGILTTGSGKPSHFKPVDERTAKRINKKLGIEELDELPITSNEILTTTFGGPAAVNQQVEPANGIRKKLKVDNDEDTASLPTTEFGTLTTGSGKPVTVDAQAAERISKKLGNKASDESPTSAFGILTTGSGTPVTVDNEAAKRLQKKMGLFDDDAPPTSEFGTLTTGSGREVSVNTKTAAKMIKKLGLDNDVEDDCPPTSAFGTLTTGSGREVSVNTKAAAKMIKKLGLDNDVEDDCPPTSAFGTLTTGSGREVSVNTKAAAKMIKKLGLDNDVEDDCPPTSAFGTLTTGSGREVSVDVKAAAKIRTKLGLNDDDYNESEHHPAVGTLTTASGREVSVDEEKAATIRKKLGLTDGDTKVAEQTENETTASGKRQNPETSPTPLRSSKFIQRARPSGISTPNLRRPSLGKRQLHKSAALQSFAAGRQSNTKGFKPPKKIAASVASVVEPAAEQKPKRVSDLAIPTPAGILRKYPSQVPGGITSGMHHRARAGECMDQIVFPLNSENLSLQLGSTLGSNAIEKLFQSFNIELSNKSLCPTNLRELLLKLGASEKHVTLRWVQHHTRLLLIKFSQQDNTYSVPSCLIKFSSAENLLSQLIYRYNKEYAQGVRSPLLQIYHKDRDTTGRCLCLKLIKCSAELKTVEVTDGWYIATARIDSPLCEKITSGMLCVGHTILTYSPEVVIENATHPLEQVEPSVLLNINYNSTRKCVGLRLGYQKRGLIPQLRLSNIHPEGGTVPCIEVCVQRKYPPAMVETVVNGKEEDENSETRKQYIIRSVAEEHRCHDLFRKKQEDAAADCRYDIERTIQKTIKQPRSDSPTEHERYRNTYQQMSEKLLSEKQSVLQQNQRTIHERHELLLSDASHINNQLTNITFKTYSNLYGVLEPLQEGNFAYIYNCTPSRSQTRPGNEKFTMTVTPLRRKCFSKMIKEPTSNEVYNPRSVVTIDCLQSLQHCTRFDTIGIVLQTGAIREYPGTEIQSIVLCCSGTDSTGRASNSILRIEAKRTAAKVSTLASAAHSSKQGCVIGFLDLQYVGSQVVNTSDGGSLVVHVASLDEKSSVKEQIKYTPHLNRYAADVQTDIYNRLRNKSGRIASAVRQATPTINNTPRQVNTETALSVTPMSVRGNGVNVTVPPPELAPSPGVSAECVQKTCFESVLHVFGHFTLPWWITLSDPTSNATITSRLMEDCRPPTGGQLPSWLSDSSFSMKCSLQDGWSELKCVTMDKHCFQQLLLGGNSEINSKARQLLLGLLEGGVGDLGDERKQVLNQYSSSVLKIFACLCSAFIVDGSSGKCPPDCVPFSAADWKLFYTTLASNANIFLKATLRQRSSVFIRKSAEAIPPQQQLQWTVHKVFPLTHAVVASDLY